MKKIINDLKRLEILRSKAKVIEASLNEYFSDSLGFDVFIVYQESDGYVLVDEEANNHLITDELIKNIVKHKKLDWSEDV